MAINDFSYWGSTVNRAARVVSSRIEEAFSEVESWGDGYSGQGNYTDYEAKDEANKWEQAFAQRHGAPEPKGPAPTQPSAQKPWEKMTADQWKGYYRTLAREYHPDHNSGDPKATERFQKLNSWNQQAQAHFQGQK